MKTYYIVRNGAGYYVTGQPTDGRMDHVTRVRKDATQFPNVNDALKFSGAAVNQDGFNWFMGGGQIIRVEETPGETTRELVFDAPDDGPCVIQYFDQYGVSYFTGDCWVGKNIKRAKVYGTLKKATLALADRLRDYGLCSPSRVIRVIDIPGTPTIRETVLT